MIDVSDGPDVNVRLLSFEGFGSKAARDELSQSSSSQTAKTQG